ncbi:MAG: precorrin-3B C(17)-methyltransferase, partial [Candidatus Binatia bacterium]
MSTETRGKLFLVGFGPGAHDHITPRARQAIAESEVVIGYSTYIKLIADLLDGKQVIRKGMTEELDRASEAIDLARAGKIVALVSSGDIGIYGMAGPTFECLRECGWQPGDNPDVEVVPGVTALSACASLLGAPLMHDFAAISLSDLLTPWPVIERRIAAAAAGDFIIALYNPQSKRRTWQLGKTQEILLRYRTPVTPVGIVKSAYRKLQHIVITDLAHMPDHEIGMLTTILVGNSNTEQFC